MAGLLFDELSIDQCPYLFFLQHRHHGYRPAVRNRAHNEPSRGKIGPVDAASILTVIEEFSLRSI